MTKICIVGAGVIGCSTALYLTRLGHQVVLVDQQAVAGLESSFGNGGQLSYSYVAPLASPTIIRKLPSLLIQSDPPLKITPKFDLNQWRWCLNFLKSCTTVRWNKNFADLFRLSALSRFETNQLVADSLFDFDFRHSGKLVFFRDQLSFESAINQLELQAKLGCEQYALSGDECISREPALAVLRTSIAGGIFTPSDDCGDCHKFTLGLFAYLRSLENFEAELSFPVNSFRQEGRRVRALVGPNGEIEADEFVIAAGNGSKRLAATLDYNLPIYPLGGYSLTAPVGASTAELNVSVTDSDRKVVYVRLGERIRAAAMVDLGGVSTQVKERRIWQLRREVSLIFPKLELDSATAWVGYRPATPDGKPIIGRLGDTNVWLNVGHGALGFTLACGSAKLLSDLIGTSATGCDRNAFELDPARHKFF